MSSKFALFIIDSCRSELYVFVLVPSIGSCRHCVWHPAASPVQSSYNSAHPIASHLPQLLFPNAINSSHPSSRSRTSSSFIKKKKKKKLTEHAKCPSCLARCQFHMSPTEAHQFSVMAVTFRFISTTLTQAPSHLPRFLDTLLHPDPVLLQDSQPHPRKSPPQPALCALHRRETGLAARRARA